MSFKKGDFLKIDYEARIVSTDQIFDTTKPELAAKNGITGISGPETIAVGEGYVIKGLDEEIEKHSVGEEFEINVPAEKAFGTRNPDVIKTFPQKMFAQEKITPVPGLVINIGGMNGKILSSSGGRVRIDFNHPLAGKALKYKVKILEEVKDEPEKIKAIIKARLRMDSEVEKKENELIIKPEKEIVKPIQEVLEKDIAKHITTKIKFENPKK